MRAELLKLRRLPTPRWTAAGTLGVLLITIVVSLFTGVGEDVAVGLGADLPTAVAAIVIGVWIVGVEYGQGTMRRALTADPRRGHVIAAKLAAALLAVAVLTIVVYAIAAVVLPPIASAHGDDLTVADAVRMGLAALAGNLPAAAVGVGVALITRSMAGAMTIALVFAFVIDTALSAIPRVGDYTFANSSFELWEAIVGEDGDHNVVRAVTMLVAWVAAFLIAGAVRFIRSDA